jgi:phospholipid transport system substrate-binding protein
VIFSLFTRVWLFGVVVVLWLSPTAYAQSSAQPAAPTAAVEKLHDALIANMKDGMALGFDGRVAKLKPVVAEVFDLPTMARISTGATAWGRASEAERAAIIDAFGAWTTASYAGNFSTWNGETFVTKSQSPDDGKGNILVNTQLNPKGMAPVAFNYRMQNIGGTWKVVDIFLDGAISQLATFRAQFSSVLGKGGVSELVAHMNRLAAEAKK